MSALVRILSLAAPPPSLDDNTGDLDRLQRAVTGHPEWGGGGLRVPYRCLAAVAADFRGCGFKGTAVLHEIPPPAGLPVDEGAAPDFELVDFLPAPPACLPALALDLGTTHLEAVLLDLLSGAELARGNRANSQIAYGADILSRIQAAGQGERLSGLVELHRAVIADVNVLATELAAQIGMKSEQIRALSLAGNTVMGHFFLQLNPYHLCREPYIPVVNAPGPAAAAELGLALHPAAPVHLLPGVGSYFGGDLLAGIVACDLDQAEEPAMLIDVGTNAEVVVGCRDWLVACAGAAGPALEGGVAKMGMRAGAGVIERVKIEPTTGELSYQVIGEPPAAERPGKEGEFPANGPERGSEPPRPRGICGSGMIDLMAELFMAGIIDIRGKFRPERMGGRQLTGPDGLAFVVAFPEEAAGGEAVTVSQVDLDALMRSKAAMYAILGTLMEKVGLPFTALACIYVAGAFGRHINPRQAVVLGMIPDLPLDTYRPVGNSSLAGACRYLLEAGVRRRIAAVARKITYIELNVNHEFMIRFSGSRFIPHTDRGLFPSVVVPE
ncbi:ASKHA domain-containing protein [Desulfurivibrio alkaliphilus]|uniref:Iron-sulfur cluster binding protein n=1 Tax=Desulfurivibrio alkaliphilus (strain DSM 19089 / UNIQEM U267 / AHT2) TaxID=589865 RepID=D6Z3E1_DESAT|nr:ASKHA domain-containing protein [Desulfurivibrio alkaliphilus]ADH86066.1 iron-sulfur cluster binding protein [Desulfurivibrio alkaliphilus AHT 2]